MVTERRLLALAHGAAALPAKAVRRLVENVASQASARVSALGAVLSEIWFVQVRVAAFRPACGKVLSIA